MLPTARHDDLMAELAGAAGAPWAIMESRLPAISAIVADAARGRDVGPDRLRSAIGTGDREDGVIRVRGRGAPRSVAIVPISGLILFGIHFPPFATSTVWLRATIQTLAADPDVAGIVLNVNSPGGTVSGTPEAAAAIREARASKPITAVSNWLSASAAFWLSSQAGRIVALPSAMVGSVGVFMLHTDFSRALEMEGVRPTFIAAGEHKTEGNMFEPLSGEARAYYQAEVDTIYRAFVHDVAKGRGVSAETVKADFGKGRTVDARRARLAGMIDTIDTVDNVMARALAEAAPARGAQLSPATASPHGATLGEILGAALAAAKET